MHHDLLFETDRFNLSEVGEHFINPCCFGEDLASWLRTKLVERGVRASEPGQEDWGWYLGAEYAGRSYFIGIGGNADEPGEPGSVAGAAEAGADRNGGNRGEWRIMVEPHRSLRDRLVGRGQMTPDDEMLTLIRSILAAEPDFENLRSDAGA